MTEQNRIVTRRPSDIARSQSFEEAMRAGRYQGYTYAYPHKTSYRWFDSPVTLRDAWSEVSMDDTFLYVHVPFCEMRCGFCNLFTSTDPTSDRETKFVDALARQARIVRSTFDSVNVRVGAIGGGTPTILSSDNLQRVFDVFTDTFGADFRNVPVSVETSPDTADADKVALLAANGVSRVSIGIQSWLADELRAMGRPQNVERAHDTVDRLRNCGIPTLNIDLIYGVDGQTSESMRTSIESTLRHEPDEVFLYPLYVRPLTGLGRNTNRSWDDERLHLYQVGREALLSAGFRQVSMRRFERTSSSTFAVDYDCQQDPMIGLGPGSRSYTPEMHYSSDWAVGRDGVRSIIDSYIAADAHSHEHAHYGIALRPDDRRRRFILQGLLHEVGVDHEGYRSRFGASVLDDFPQLHELIAHGLAGVGGDGRVRLTADGFSWSDAIGPWLYGDAVVQQMSAFEIR